MKHLLIKAALIFLSILAGAGLYHHYAGGKTAPTAEASCQAPTPTADVLARSQRAWLGALEWCESRGKPEAINPKDRDGTPSYGAFQFKPATFAAYQKRYGLKGAFMDPEAQENIVEQMILQGGINWANEFPACSKKLGTPPLSPKAMLPLANS